FAPPGGSWDFTDNGPYSVSVEPSQVTDTNMHPVAANIVGTIQVAIGTSFVVTNTFDSGPGSLRQAVLDANSAANPGTDTISFDAAVFSMPQMITVSSTITITDAVVIQGTGPANVTISGGNQKRIFNIDGPGNFPVTLDKLTLTGGKVIGAGGAGRFVPEGDLALSHFPPTPHPPHPPPPPSP